MNLQNMDELKKRLGDKTIILGQELITLSMTEQPCDVTFYNQKPILDVKVNKKYASALLYGAGAKKMSEMFRNIMFSDGTQADFKDIWIILPMPMHGISQQSMDEVDMSEGNTKIEPSGETVRKMISSIYHCESKEEEDYYLRRFLAS
jgi:hypothetical protein